MYYSDMCIGRTHLYSTCYYELFLFIFTPRCINYMRMYDFYGPVVPEIKTILLYISTINTPIVKKTKLKECVSSVVNFGTGKMSAFQCDENVQGRTLMGFMTILRNDLGKHRQNKQLIVVATGQLTMLTVTYDVLRKNNTFYS